MAKFRRKPIVQEIEAVQFNGEANIPQWSAFLQDAPYLGNNNSMSIKTASGLAEVVLGDWLIKEQDGSGFYPCKDEIFRERYEEIKE